MLEFKTLNRYAGSLQREAQHHEIHQRAIQRYARGFSYLTKAQVEHFRDLDDLLKAFQAFSDAIQLNRRDPRPYLMCAYLCMLIDDFVSAQDYLQGLKELVGADNGIVEAFEASLLAQAHSSSAPKLQKIPGQDMDFDALYDEVEAYIQQAVRRAMHEHLPEALAEPETFKRLQQLQQDYTQLLQSASERLEIIDQEIEIGDLEKALQPLRQIVRQLNQRVRFCAQKQELLEFMSQLEQQAKTLEDKLAKSNCTQAFRDLDGLLNLCDRTADQLDEMSQHTSIEDLEPRYNQLIAFIQALQEALDEC